METFLIKDLIRTGIEILFDSAAWMGWNLFLAFIPLYLSIYLFRDPEAVPVWQQAIYRYVPKHMRRGLWGVMVLVFIGFLPNAPYILTDVIHLNRFILAYNSLWVTGFIIAPLFFLFISAGFLAYVLSVINVGYYLHKQGKGRWIPAIEITLHLLCAIGVFVGRFPRLNSWYFVTQPERVVDTMTDTLSSSTGILGILIGFIVITMLYIPTKEVVLALAAYRKKRSIYSI